MAFFVGKPCNHGMGNMIRTNSETVVPETVDMCLSRVGKIAMLAALSNEHEEATIKSQVDGLDNIKLAVTFISGMSREIRSNFIKSLVGCALQNNVVNKSAGQIHAVIHAGLDALNGAMSHTPVDASVKLKVAIASDTKWISVALYGDSAFYPITNHERACMSMMHL
jgi:hut operon positive regulator